MPRDAAGILGRSAGKEPQPPAWVAWAALSAHGHRKKMSPPSFIFLAGCVLDVALKGPLKQHKLPQTLLLC